MATRRSVIKVSLSTLIALVLVVYLWLQSTERVHEDLVPAPSEMAAQPVPDFTDFDNVEDKKKAFFDYLRPEIEAQNQHLLGIRHRLLLLQRKVDTKTRELAASEARFRSFFEQSRSPTKKLKI